MTSYGPWLDVEGTVETGDYASETVKTNTNVEARFTHPQDEGHTWLQSDMTGLVESILAGGNDGSISWTLDNYQLYIQQATAVSPAFTDSFLQVNRQVRTMVYEMPPLDLIGLDAPAEPWPDLDGMVATGYEWESPYMLLMGASADWTATSGWASQAFGGEEEDCTGSVTSQLKMATVAFTGHPGVSGFELLVATAGTAFQTLNEAPAGTEVTGTVDLTSFLGDRQFGLVVTTGTTGDIDIQDATPARVYRVGYSLSLTPTYTLTYPRVRYTYTCGISPPPPPPPPPLPTTISGLYDSSRIRFVGLKS